MVETWYIPIVMSLPARDYLMFKFNTDICIAYYAPQQTSCQGAVFYSTWLWKELLTELTLRHCNDVQSCFQQHYTYQEIQHQWPYWPQYCWNTTQLIGANLKPILPANPNNTSSHCSLLSLSARFHHSILRGRPAQSAGIEWAVAMRISCPAKTRAVRATFSQLRD